VGPSTSGKTDIAIALAKEHDASIACCDSLQLYGGFKIGAGIRKNQFENVATFLYGYFNALDFNDFYEPCNRYGELVNNLRVESFSSGKPLIFEGCSANYVNILKKNYSDTFGKIHVIGLLPLKIGLEEKLKKRLLEMIDDGVLNEIEQLLDEGFGNTPAMKMGVVYNPFKSYLEGKQSFGDSISLILNWGAKVINTQHDTFSKMKDIIPIEISLNSHEQTLEKVNGIIGKL